MRLQAPVYIPLTILGFIAIIFSFAAFSGFHEVSQADQAFEEADYSQAAASYQKALMHLPWRVDLFDRLGRSIADSDPESAMEYLAKARKHGTLSADGWVLLGGLYWGYLDDEGSALKTWQAGLEAFPDNTDFHYWLSKVYLSRGDYVSELAILKDWMDIEDAEFADAHYRLGLLLGGTDPNRALAELVRAAVLDQDYDPAVYTMRTAINLATLEKDRSRKSVILGRGLGLVNEWALAKMAFQQAVEADPLNPEAWAWLGESKQHLNEDGSADLIKAVDLGSANPDIRGLFGVYYLRNAQFEQALAEYSAAIELDPENPNWQVSSADALALSGDLPAAVEAYRRAAGLAPDEARYWRTLALFCAHYNIYLEETGLPAAMQAVGLNEDDAESQAVLGWLYVKLYRTEEAEQTLQLAIQIDPELPDAHYYLGYLYLQNSRFSLAREELQQAQDLGAAGLIGARAQALLDEYFR
ncbi:MAG: tetratricopeptide repeat protein [Anaerolineales bacterium]|nr:tetratricopeptide repeat protein [Anaerolineales bacterium]